MVRGFGPTTKHLTPLQERFLYHAVQDLSDQEFIELLLNLCLPPRKAGKLAKIVIEKCHTLSGFVLASTKILQGIGIPDNCIVGIRLIHEMPLHVLKQMVLDQPTYQSSRQLFDYLRYSMQDLTKEVFKVVFLDENKHIKEIVDLATGTRKQISISLRDIIESSLTQDADSLILVHNHPSGNPKPSKTDAIFTRDAVFIGILLQINVLDHIIIGRDTYFSFADAGLLEKYRDSFLNMKIRGILGASELYQPYTSTVEAPLQSPEIIWHSPALVKISLSPIPR
jgi:DNA repair protein RadC